MLLVTAVLLLVLVLPPEIGIPLVVLAAFGEVLEVVFWRRFLSRYRVVTGAEGLIGEEAIVAEACEPDGSVRLRGEIWRARAGARCALGERVRVTGVDGLTLEVEPVALNGKGPR